MSKNGRSHRSALTHHDNGVDRVYKNRRHVREIRTVGRIELHKFYMYTKRRLIRTGFQRVQISRGMIGLERSLKVLPELGAIRRFANFLEQTTVCESLFQDLRVGLAQTK